MRYTLLGVGCLLGVLSLVGCETMPPPPPEAVADPATAWDQRQVRLYTLTQWSAVGRIAIRSPNDSWTATVRWTQEGERYRLRLSGPLGQGVVEVSGEPGRVELRTADRKVFTASDPDQLVLARTGWKVPVAGLRHWILGAAAPATPPEDLVLDRAGRLQSLRQSGWQLTYQRYGGPRTLPLPTKLTMVSKDFSVKLVIGRWRISG